METPLKQEPKSESPVETLTTVQDGGTRAWCTLVGGWLALFATFGYSSSFGVYQDFYTVVGTSSSSGISWIGSVQIFLNSFMGLIAGRLLDKGYFRHVTLTGSVIYIFSLFMLSLAKPSHFYQVFLSQGIGSGIGAGLVYLPAMAVQAHHWRERRALAMGVVITGSSFGGIVYPIMLNHLFHGSAGFAWGVRASAFMNLALLVIANCLMSARPPVKKAAPESPKPELRALLLDAPFMITIIGAFLVFWGLFFPYFYLQVFSILHGIPTNLAFYTLTIQNAASVFGRTIPNFLADRIGVLNVLSFVSLSTGVLVFAMFGITNTGGVVVFALLYGFFSGAFLSLLAPAAAVLSRDVSEIGIRMGIAFFVTSFACLTGTPIDGALLNNGFAWFKPIIFSGTIILTAMPLLLLGRTIQARRKQSQLV